MLMYLLAGVSLGLSAGFSPGPLFAMVISHTLRFGTKEGVKVAFSPLVTDVPIVILCTFLMYNLYAYQHIVGYISLTGSFFVLYLAYETMKVDAIREISSSADTNSLLKAAVVNFLSPHPYLFWIAVGSPMILKAYQEGIGHAAAFLIGFYICLIGAKIVLAVVVSRSRSFLTGRKYFWLMKVLGGLLLLFALLLFADGWHLLQLL